MLDNAGYEERDTHLLGQLQRFHGHLVLVTRSRNRDRVLDINRNGRIVGTNIHACDAEFKIVVSPSRKQCRIPPLSIRRRITLPNQHTHQHSNQRKHKTRLTFKATHPNVLLQSLKLRIQSRLLSTLRNPLLQLLQLSVLAQLIPNLHVLALGIEPERTTNTFSRCSVKSAFRSSGRTGSVGIGLGLDGNGGDWRRGWCWRIASVGLEMGALASRGITRHE